MSYIIKRPSVLDCLFYAGTLAITAFPPTAFGGNCNLDLPLRWTVNPTFVDNTPAGITGDGSPYVNGQSGVAATIKVCAGTNDAVLQSGQRSLSISFEKRLASTSNTPSWAVGKVTGSGWLNIRNITFVPINKTRADEYTFTTRAGMQVPVRGFWFFRMWHPETAAISTTGDYVAMANTPYASSLVNVTHCPANSTPPTTGNCTGIMKETWFVTADTQSGGTSSESGLPLVQVGGLMDLQKSTPVNGGQFSVSFSYVISLMQ